MNEDDPSLPDGEPLDLSRDGRDAVASLLRLAQIGRDIGAALERHVAADAKRAQDAGKPLSKAAARRARGLRRVQAEVDACIKMALQMAEPPEGPLH